MSWKKLLLVMAAATSAAYFGSRLAAPESASLALAAGASVSDAGSGMVAVTTAAGGTDTNRLVMVDTNKKRLLIYKLRPNCIRLIAARPYKYDLKLLSTDPVNIPGNGLTYEDTEKLILDSQMKEEDKKSVPRGRELVVTTDGTTGSDGNRIILINTTEKRILIYRLNGNFIGLLAARSYEYDNYQDFRTTGFAPGDGFDYTTIKDTVEKELKKGIE